MATYNVGVVETEDRVRRAVLSHPPVISNMWNPKRYTFCHRGENSLSKDNNTYIHKKIKIKTITQVNLK